MQNSNLNIDNFGLCDIIKMNYFTGGKYGVLDEKTNEIKLPSNASLIIRTSEEETYIICEVCGAKNEIGKELCRVCSNYLDEGDNEK